MSPTPKRSGPKVPMELAAPQLRWRCDASKFRFETTDELGDGPINIIGQPRAMEALKLGLAIRSAGYNIFVAGEVGTGRSTAVKRQLAAVERGDTAPDDLVYVYNFKDAYQPRLLSFPAGKGRAFRKALEDLVEGFRKHVPELFDSDPYRKRRSEKIDAAKELQKERLKEFEKRVQAEGFALVQVQLGPVVRPDLMPVVAGNPVAMSQLESLVEEEKFQRREFDRLKSKYAKLTEAMEILTKEFRDLERDLRRELIDLDRELARPLVREATSDLKEEFPGERVAGFIDEAAENILDHLDRFRDGEEPPSSGAERDRARAEVRERMLPYAVNVLVDNAETKGRPIIWETSPTYRNLFGTLERARDASGEWSTDHTRVKGGSLARANGGFLVVDALDVLAESGVWPALKRTLRNQVIEIQTFDPFNLCSNVSTKPEPIPLDVKVILIGTRQIYRLLHALDEDFKKIFEVKADFAVETPRSADELKNYAAFVRKKCQDDRLPPFHREAVAAVVEHGVRLAGRQEKITTRFNEVADVIREAGYWAKQEKAKRVDARHVDQAIAQRVRRVDLVEEVLRERFADGTMLVDLDGEKVGQVNGLVILDVGDHAFGLPSRITASTAVGRAGIVDIDREAEMSGAIHTKGVLILAGFLRSRFAQDKPLALSASLCFEQSYDEIDGDSASSSELYALLSSLSGVPIRQSIAVTGSVNQRGEIQPIGGVNEKIEGYFDLCRLKGLTGEQGVLIPSRNLTQLMLRKDVVEEVEKGRFRIFAISTIEAGIEILTGLPAGERAGDGSWPRDSVFGRVDARLAELALKVREYGLADLPSGP
ncbi:MAG: AAA family ATPase [Acidobacteriia bacterium]|nr:AAA family ATPase [Terriglobia bacterium]